MTEEFPVVWEDPEYAGISWEREDMHTPNALTPLASDYFKAVMEGFNRHFRALKLPFEFLCTVVNYYTYVGRKLHVTEEEMREMQESTRDLRREWMPKLRAFWEENALPQLKEMYRAADEAPVESLAPDELAEKVREVWEYVPQAFRLHSMTTAGAYGALDELADLYESFFPEAHPGEALALVQGLPTDLQRVQTDIYELAQVAAARPAVRELLIQDSSRSFEEIAAVPGGGEFEEALNGFLGRHGHLGHAFDDLTLPSWLDEPAAVLAEVRKRLRDEAEDPEKRRSRLREKARAAADGVHEKLRERPGDLEKFESALKLAESVGPLTEEHNYWLDRMLQSSLRRFVMRVGRRLAGEGTIEEPEDVFMLHPEEIAEAVISGRNFRDLIEERKRDLARWREVSPPRHLGKPRSGEEERPLGRFTAPLLQSHSDGVLKGIGATTGVAKGPARIVMSPADFLKVGAGDILVCPSSNPSWVPLFGIIAGLVTNTGGVLSHAAVVAREFGIPAVVNTGSATSLIEDGTIVEVDAGSGEVRIL